MLSEQIKSSISNFLKLIERLDNEDYNFSENNLSSTGSHIRHCIDRMNCFINGIDNKLINYDLRDRNLEIETNKELAKEKLNNIFNFFVNFANSNYHQEIEISETLDPNYEATTSKSTLKREISDMIIHNTHHLAIIKLTLKNRVNLGDDFGKAPSTIIHENTQCAA